jgi:SAM-dependent methyltransferase
MKNYGQPIGQDNTYRNGLFAKNYDFIVDAIGLRDFEVAFWKCCARKYGGPILEMGCGTGRILLPLAEMGYSVTGVDISFQMLKVLEQKLQTCTSTIKRKVKYYQGDMSSSLVGSGKYNLIIFCGNQFMHLKTDEERIACLKNCKDLLTDDGAILISNNSLPAGVQRRFVTISSDGDGRKLQMRYTWRKGVYMDFFKLLLKGREKEHLFCWSLYPLRKSHMNKLIRQAELEYELPPVDMPIERRADVYVCRKRH